MSAGSTPARAWAALACALLVVGCTRAVAEAPTQAAAPPAQAAPIPRPQPPLAIPVGFERLDVVTPSGTTSFAVEIADNDATRERGLMFRQSLAPDRGMLFDFRAPREVAFWMKNTPIPLDIVFIRADGRVLSIAAQTTPQSLEPIPSGGAILGVLEIAGGRAQEIGLLPGDRVIHRIFPKP